LEEQKIQEEIVQGNFESLMELLAKRIAAYHNALIEQKIAPELAEKLVRTYAELWWTNFFAAGRK
jgi:hypothetical protein